MQDHSGGSSVIEKATFAVRPLYASLEYARAFGYGVFDVEEWRTPVLIRDIPSSQWQDALGCYPLAAIHPQADLEAGLDRLRSAGLISIALVPDPITSPSPEKLAKRFLICRPFKTHYVIDRDVAPPCLPQTHRRWMRKAERMCTIERVTLQEKLEDWLRLYDLIVTRHQIRDVQRFSPKYFSALSRMPEVEAFGACVDEAIVAMALWVRGSGVVYYHLGASNEEGYRSQAMYGIFAAAQEYFRDYPLIHLGSAAGVEGETNTGLARFKRGFANREVLAYFCGAPLDEGRYSALVRDQASTSFFPAYRQT
jgi:hypothetical protein